MAASPRNPSARRPVAEPVPPLVSPRRNPHSADGHVLLLAALAMLIAWALGMLFSVGELVHILLLVGLLLLLLALLQGRDAAGRPGNGSEPGGR